MADPTRPRLHLTARQGWINDPHGLTWHDGEYHQFFQYVPGQTEWGPNCHWGHATSPNLLHWTEQPVALTPDHDDDQDDGCWSGSVVVPPGEPATLFYTTVTSEDPQIGRIRVARPTADDWSSWTKGEVVVTIPEDMDAVAFRDPYVFFDGTRWRMVLSAGLHDGTALAPAYSSPDLQSWTYDGPLASRRTEETQPLWTGSVWECAQFFPLGDRWVLTVSVWEPVQPYYEAYAVGTYVDGVFTVEHWDRLTYGPSYYAGSATVDRDGHRTMTYWLREMRDPNGEWAGAHSLPHRLTLDGDTVVAQPHPALDELRGEARPVAPSAGRVAVPPLADIVWTLGSLDAEASLTLLAGTDVVASLRAEDGTLTIVAGDHLGSIPLRANEVRVVIDGPVVEVFTRAGSYALPVTSEVSLTLEASGSGQALAYPLDKSD